MRVIYSCFLMTAALTPLLTACAHWKRTAKPLGPDIDSIMVPWNRPTDSNPKPKDPPPDPERVPISYGQDRFTPQRHERLHPRFRSYEEPPFEQERDQAGLPPKHASETPPPPGAKPDEGEPSGHPAADKPDRMAALPTTGQPRYFSPAPLKEDKSRSRSPNPLEEPEEFGDGDVADGLTAKRAAFAPAATAALADVVPETGVADPNSLGSYHVQVSASPDFRKIMFNKVYGFMADIDIDKDLVVAGTRPGVYWIRWSLVDLLEFEHPFSRPQRMKFENPYGY